MVDRCWAIAESRGLRRLTDLVCAWRLSVLTTCGSLEAADHLPRETGHRSKILLAQAETSAKDAKALTKGGPHADRVNAGAYRPLTDGLPMQLGRS